MKKGIKILVLLIIVIIASVIFTKKTSAQQNNLSFQVFYDQLSPYGQWVDYQNYGYVWMPNAGPDFPPGNKKAGPLKVRLERVSQTGRGERSQTDPGDLNVPLRLECVLTGRKQWLEDAS